MCSPARLRQARVRFALASVSVAAFLSGCGAVDEIRQRIAPRTSPHAEYADALRAAGLTASPLAGAWVEAASEALVAPRKVDLPFHDEGWLAPDAPGAIGVRFTAPRARWITVRAHLDAARPALVFVDAFRSPTDSDARFIPLAATDSPGVLRFRVWRGGAVIVRAQPELLRGGRYERSVTIEDERPTTSGVEATRTYAGAER